MSENIKDLVLRMRDENKVVITWVEGMLSMDLDEMLDNQPIEGVLYDLNRLPEVALTFMEKDIKWVNDFAVSMVITRLHERCVAKDARIAELEEQLSEVKP